MPADPPYTTTGSTFHRPVITATPEVVVDDPLAADLITLDTDLYTIEYPPGSRRPSRKLVASAGAVITRAQYEAWGGDRDGFVWEGETDEDIGEGE